MTLGRPYLHGMPLEDKRVLWHDLKKRSGLRMCSAVWVRFRFKWKNVIYEGTTVSDTDYHVGDELNNRKMMVKWTDIEWLDMNRPDEGADDGHVHILTLKEIGPNRFFVVGTTEQNPENWNAWDEVELVIAATPIEAIRMCGHHPKHSVAEVDMGQARHVMKAPPCSED